MRPYDSTGAHDCDHFWFVTVHYSSSVRDAHLKYTQSARLQVRILAGGRTVHFSVAGKHWPIISKKFFFHSRKTCLLNIPGLADNDRSWFFSLRAFVYSCFDIFFSLVCLCLKLNYLLVFHFARLLIPAFEIGFLFSWLLFSVTLGFSCVSLPVIAGACS